MPRKQKATPVETQEDPTGRADILLMRTVKRIVDKSNDPAIMAFYGRFGNTINTMIADVCGPFERRRGSRA